jgi:excisionase family DNA binding protein
VTATEDTALTLTPEEVARRLGISRYQVCALMDRGRLRAADVGAGRRRFRRTSERWLAEFLGGRKSE